MLRVRLRAEPLPRSFPEQKLPGVELCRVEEPGLRRFDANGPFKNLAVSKLQKDFQKLGESRIHLFVDLFIRLNRLDKLKLIGGHFTFLGGLAIIAKTPAGAASALECVSAIFGRPAFDAVVTGGLRALDSSIEARSAVNALFAATIRSACGPVLALG